MNDYTNEVRERWGDTPAYTDFESRRITHETQEILAREMMDIFAEFGAVRDLPPDSEIPQALAKKLQSFISGHFYRCSDEVFASLGKMYVFDERFRNNIDSRAGEGTAGFVSRVIGVYTSHRQAETKE